MKRGLRTLAGSLAPLIGLASGGWTQAPPPEGGEPERPFPRRAVNRGCIILRRMVQAERERAFIAREVTTLENGMTFEQWVKRDPRRGMRRESIRPPGELFVDNGRRAFWVSQRLKRYGERDSAAARMRQRATETLRRIGPGGDLRVEWKGQDVVAGRVADILSVRPPEGVPGPSRRFWVDRETGLRLRSEERAPDGRILSLSYYLSVDLSPVLRDEDFAAPEPPAGFQPVKERRQVFSTLEAASKAGYTPHQPGYIPAGFTLRAVEIFREGDRITQRWGNDITVVSLVEMKGPPRLPRGQGEPPSGFLPWPGGTRAYAFKSGERHFVVIGALADDELKRIADSVR